MNKDRVPPQIFELGDRVVRSWWTLVAGLSVGLSASLLILHLTPKVFEGTAILDTRTERLTENFQVPSTVGDFDSQIERLEQAALSEANLERIAAEEFGASTADPRFGAALDAIRTGIRTRYSGRTGELRIGFQSDDPVLAASVANTLADTYIEEYRKLRSGLAGENTKALESMMEAAFRELQAKNEEIRAFRSKHAGATGDRLPANQRREEELEQELKEKRIERAAAEDRVRSIREEQDLQESFDLMPSETTLNPGSDSSVPAELSELRRQLERLRIRYSDGHPEIQATKRRIAEIEKNLAENEGTAVSPRQQQPKPKADLKVWDSYLQVEQRRIERLKNEERGIEREIRALQNLISGTDVVQHELSEMILVRDVLERRYSDARTQVELARAAELGEENQISGVVVIRSRAFPPSLPVSPKPLPLVGACTVAALLLFIGPMVVRWFFLPVVSSEAGLRTLADVPVLVSIPRFDTPHTRGLIRRQRLRNFGLSFVFMTLLGCTVAVRLLELV